MIRDFIQRAGSYARRKLARNRMAVVEFAPRSMLELPDTTPDRPRYPIIDVHVHLNGPHSGGRRGRSVDDLLAEMDAASIEALVDLDGGWGSRLDRELRRYVGPCPERFLVFSGVDYSGFRLDDAFGQREAQRLRESVAMGARGLKVWKALGLSARDSRDRLVPVDDRRLDPLWEAAAELGVPTLIHVADPAAFFAPMDRNNERWEELQENPTWRYGQGRSQPGEHGAAPALRELLEQFVRVLERHPETTFIAAHMLCAEDLWWVSDVLDRHRNLFVEMSARVAELGRQPYSARDFLIRHHRRVLFGTDTPPDRHWYRLYRRFLETRDEYFNYALTDPPHQGRWRIYGLGLPAQALEAIYRLNARRIIWRDRT